VAGLVLLVGLISKSGTSRPGPVAGRVVLAGRAGASGWASATSWASESEPETCIFELNWVVL